MGDKVIILSDDSSGFVAVADIIPDVILDIRYYSENNFIGDRIDGYEEPAALLTKKAAYALKNAGDEVNKRGFSFRIFDAYRPQTAVDHFVRCGKKLKKYFFLI